MMIFKEHFDQACPKCQEEGRDSSEDNLRVFESGWGHCCAGHGRLTPEEIEGLEITTNAEVKKEKRSPKVEGLEEGVYANIPKWNISKETCQFYDYKVNYEKRIHIANYHDDAGNVVMQQVRTETKDFYKTGKTEQHKFDLWGLDRHTPNENLFITIVEGEKDLLTVAEVFQRKYPVASLPNGAGKNAIHAIKKNMHKLQQFKYVVLAFDNDEVGKQAVEECIPLFEPGKLRIAKWRLKDAGELMEQGVTKEIRDTIYNAVEYLPEPIIYGEKLLESLNGFKNATVSWPWKNANNKIAPINIPAIYTIAAREKIGKTEFVMELMRAAVGDGERVGIVALEQTIQHTMLKLVSSLSGINLTNIKDRELTAEEKDLCSQFSDNIIVYDHIHYGSDIYKIVDAIPYMVKTLNCKFIVFDNLSYAATSLGDNERMGIDKAMIALKDSTVKYQYTLFNVCHLKRDDFNIGENDEPRIEMIRGSGGIAQYSDCVIGLFRPVGDDDDHKRNTLTAYVLADRMTGQDTGKKWMMRFDQDTRRLGDL